MPSMDEMCLAGRTSRRGIRLWEEKGLLGTVERSAGGTRRYTVEQIRRAKIIAACQALGYTLEATDKIIMRYDFNVRAELSRDLRYIGDDLPSPVDLEYDL